MRIHGTFCRYEWSFSIMLICWNRTVANKKKIGISGSPGPYNFLKSGTLNCCTGYPWVIFVTIKLLFTPMSIRICSSRNQLRAKSSRGSIMFSFLLLLLLQNKLFSPTLKLASLILVGFQGHFACPYNSIYCELNYNNIIDAFVYTLRKLNLFSCSKPYHNEYLCTALQIQQKKK